jgi:hypothetical protein
VTTSGDCAEVFGACDFAIGAFGPEVSLLQGSRDIIVNHWSWQRGEWDQGRWVLFDTGIVSEAEAQAWADEVWADPREERDEKRGPGAVQPIDRGSSRE